jgi:hypothetical protein
MLAALWMVVLIYGMTAGVVWAVNPGFLRLDERWYRTLMRLYDVRTLEIERVRWWIRTTSVAEAFVFGTVFLVNLLLE